MPDLIKPPFGAPCNGCGICCKTETCPIARLRYLQIAGPCPALHWDAALNRYQCGILLRARWSKPLIARWIASGIGCDMDDEQT